MKGFILCLSIGLVFFGNLVWSVDEQRDFYAEPGHNPFASSKGQDFTESIDPFSGNVQLRYVDLTIPGNGGLDISITRSYNLPQELPTYGNAFGYGWTMHFGRVVVPSGYIGELCMEVPSGPGDSTHNPSIEMPSGAREVLVRSSVLGDGTYVTKTNWRAECNDEPEGGMVVTAPTGTKYFMTEPMVLAGLVVVGNPPEVASTWLTNRIEDLDGNWVAIAYMTIATGLKVPISISSSDQRSVSFVYEEPGGSGANATPSSLAARLSTITANGKLWSYHYDPLYNNTAATGWSATNHFHLKKVVRPDTTEWQYEYGPTPGEQEYNRLTKIVYPFGGEVNYTYQQVRPYLLVPDLKITAIDTKSQTQPSPLFATGLWTYTFSPGGATFGAIGFPDPNPGRKLDLTTIATPDGTEQIYHIGYYSLMNSNLWQMGLKLQHDYYDMEGVRLRSSSGGWGARRISDEDYRGGVRPEFYDDATYAPMRTRRSEEFDTYTNGAYYFYPPEGSNFGYPSQITEVPVYSALNSPRITNFTYLNDTADWLIGLPLTDTVTEDGAVVDNVVRDYWPNGRLKVETVNGVTTQYTYTPGGDLFETIDARNHTTTYDDYKRGIPRSEAYPDETTLARTVNNTGTVQSETSGRLNVTSFLYDGLNRLTDITYPIGSPVSVQWYAAKKELTRGGYKETVEWDGFGRDVKVIREDTSIGASYSRTYVYDPVGRKVFESDANETTVGIDYAFDGIGRLVRVTNQDATFKTIDYDGVDWEQHVDEEGNSTTYTYQVFGVDSAKHLYRTESPETLTTVIGRDAVGRIKTIGQGATDPQTGDFTGYQQTYNYSPISFFLESIESPHDIGTTVYGRDELGNMTSKTVNGEITLEWKYDELSRMELRRVYSALNVSCCGRQIDYEYDDDGNLERVATNDVDVRYEYDENGNLERQHTGLVVHSNSGNSSEVLTDWDVDYGIDVLDNVETITYPSGRVVNYAPDALGRPTQAEPYLTSVSYYPNGTLETLEYANGVSTTYTRNDRNWIDEINVGALDHLDYAYDDVGNIENIWDINTPGRDRSMTYDDLYRLKTVSGRWGTSSYEYDVYSNFVRKSDPSQLFLDQYYFYNGLKLVRIQDDQGSDGDHRRFFYNADNSLFFSTNTTFDGASGEYEEDVDDYFTTHRTYEFDGAGQMPYMSLRSDDEDNKSAVAYFDYDGNDRIWRWAEIGSLSTYHVHSKAGNLLGNYHYPVAAVGIEYIYLGTQKIATAQYNDYDEDGIPDHLDNCPFIANADQSDVDENGIGDVCENSPGC